MSDDHAAIWRAIAGLSENVTDLRREIDDLGELVRVEFGLTHADSALVKRGQDAQMRRIRWVGAIATLLMAVGACATPVIVVLLQNA